MGVMVVKGHFTVCKEPELEPHNQMVSRVKFRTPVKCVCMWWWGGLPFCRDAVGIFNRHQPAGLLERVVKKLVSVTSK